MYLSKYMSITSVVFGIVLSLFICEKAINQNVFTDSRDKQVYKTIKIGDQVWMAQNLNFGTAEEGLCYDNKKIKKIKI